MSEQQVAGPQVRPLGVGELLDASIKLVRRHFKALALVTLLVSIPIEAIGGLITAVTTDFCKGASCAKVGPDTIYLVEDDVAYYGGRAAITLLGVLQFVVVQVACFRILAEGYLGHSVGAGASMRYALSRGWSTLWLGVLLLFGLVVASILLLLPGIWLAVAWSVAIPVLLVERTGGAAALRRSFRLVRGLWWSTFARLLVAALLIGVATAAVGGGLFFLFVFTGEEASYPALVFEGVINVAVEVLTTPFFAAVGTLIYFDLRVRKEGFDLAILAEGMGGGDATKPVSAASGPEATDAFGRPAAPASSASGWAPPSTPGGPAQGAGGWAPPQQGGGADAPGAWEPPSPGASPKA